MVMGGVSGDDGYGLGVGDGAGAPAEGKTVVVGQQVHWPLAAEPWWGASAKQRPTASHKK
jgi:hypothetical protein